MILNKIRAILTLLQLIITVTIVIILMYIFRSNNRKVRQVWGRMQLKLMGITLDIEGEVDKNADMIVMNHQSILDIILFEALHPNDIAWVAKKEIGDIPWFGHILKVPSMIIVERESKSSLVKLLKEAKEKYIQKRPIAIFPEGTRTDGKKLRKFKVGAKMIAEKNNMLVQPIIIVGTKKIFDSQKMEQKSGRVKVIYLPTVQAVRKTNWYVEVEEEMNQTLQKYLYDI
ncbi:MAG: 1-acyl-sn-glycerol-3-phosphate acyltransferase [Epsilonproteobacteria bacterium]|nr:MAG: 1-acyl-sn-glycerol-3-phosphate acyltransferase [Campylobacterota bacterium]